jgi:hypothetical protein
MLAGPEPTLGDTSQFFGFAAHVPEGGPAGTTPLGRAAEVPPPSRTPLSGYPAAVPAVGHPCPRALAAGHEASSAVVNPSRQYKRPQGGGPAADTAGPGVFLPSLARMNWPDGDQGYRLVAPDELTSAGHRPQAGRRRVISLDLCRTLCRQLRRRPIATAAGRLWFLAAPRLCAQGFRSSLFWIART